MVSIYDLLIMPYCKGTSGFSVLSLLTGLALINVGGSLRVPRASSLLNILAISIDALTMLAPLLRPT